MKSKNIIFLCFYCSLILLWGCYKLPAEKTLPLNEAHQKLIKLCREEYKTGIIVKPFPNTVWIYLPVAEGFMQLKANDDGPKTSNEAKETRTINFLDGKFENGVFKIQHDITLAQTYAKDYGYGNTFTEKYQNQQRDILTAISRVYNQVEPTHSTAAAQKVPDFFILVGADIVNGIETQTMFTFPDLKRVMTDAFFQDEYTKRNIMDYPKGDTKIIGDWKGTHLKTYEMTWGEFLSKQMVHRIHSKYERSAFPPTGTDQEEILKIVAEALTAYHFQGFQSVELNDLHNKKINRVAHAQMQKLIEDAASSKEKEGKLIEIHFR